MRGPILNYRLGKITHREYEAEASRYWARHGRDGGEVSLAERINLLVDRSAERLDRAWCAAAWLGPSPARCGAS